MKTIKKILPVILTIAWTLFIFANSLQQGTASSHRSGTITILVQQILSFLPLSISYASLDHIIRKSAHFIEYMILGILTFITHQPAKYQITYGIAIPLIDEGIQRFVPGRWGSILDSLLDFCGFITGYLLSYGIHHFITKTHKASR